MSASLVGSEMCIRDSPPHPLPGGNLLLWRAEDDQKRRLPPLSKEGGATVSYTHLTLPTICSV
eukprot:6807371-Alexandrium_andersonii.AAC.1